MSFYISTEQEMRAQTEAIRFLTEQLEVANERLAMQSQTAAPVEVKDSK
jgi:hypothetical protein